MCDLEVENCEKRLACISFSPMNVFFLFSLTITTTLIPSITRNFKIVILLVAIGAIISLFSQVHSEGFDVVWEFRRVAGYSKLRLIGFSSFIVSTHVVSPQTRGIHPCNYGTSGRSTHWGCCMHIFKKDAVFC